MTHASPAVRRRALIQAGAGSLLLPRARAATALPVVTTTPDLHSLVLAVGGPHVDAVTLVPPGSDAEAYVPRPQDLERLRGARLVVRIGLDYDLWLDRLLRQAGRPELLRGGPGHVDTSGAVALLDVKDGGLGGGAHAHGAGNPHYWLDPTNAEIMTGHITEALARLDAPNARYYEQRRLQFLGQLGQRVRDWQTRLAPLAGQPLLTYHNNWPYFARRFRLRFAGTIEPRPGVAPSPAALAALLRQMREQRIGIIVRHPQEPLRDVEFLARKAGARVAVLAASVGDLPAARDFLSLFDTNVAALLAAHTALR